VIRGKEGDSDAPALSIHGLNNGITFYSDGYKEDNEPATETFSIRTNGFFNGKDKQFINTDSESVAFIGTF
jgi:hypothetical protein